MKTLCEFNYEEDLDQQYLFGPDLDKSMEKAKKTNQMAKAVKPHDFPQSGPQKAASGQIFSPSATITTRDFRLGQAKSKPPYDPKKPTRPARGRGY